MRQASIEVHGAEKTHHPCGALNQPVYYSSAFEWTESEGVRYIRFGNVPNQLALGAQLASLEGAEAGVVAASGQAAIAATLMSVVPSGRELLVTRGLYGGTVDVVRRLAPRMGVRVIEIDPFDPESWRADVETAAVFSEALTSPIGRVPCLVELAHFARRHGLVGIIDNTSPSPASFNPRQIGFDVVIHSGTKYLGGHSDLVAGCALGSHAVVEGIRDTLKLIGAALDPHSCFLLQRGLKTLSLRVERQSDSALRIAEFLSSHPSVRSVSYCGLPGHCDHERAKELFRRFGGLVAFDLGSKASANAFLGRVRLPTVAPSFGGPETLVVQPAFSTHAGQPEETLRSFGITEGLIRLAVGLEDSDDLISDLQQALE